MRFSLAVVALAPILSVYADNILIQVGANNQLIFSPSNVTAKVGDTIAFQFQSKNHSLTQSTFAAPCTKNGPVDSSFQFVPAGSTQLPQFSFNVTDTTPLWFFCAQTNPVSHCGQGMVFSVNADPNSAKSHAAFQALAVGGVAVQSAASSIGSQVGGAVATATSDIASAVQQATSALPSVVSGITSAAAGAFNTLTSDIPGVVDGATSAIGGAAGAAASEAAHLLGAGVRADPSISVALLLASLVLAREMLL